MPLLVFSPTIKACVFYQFNQKVQIQCEHQQGDSLIHLYLGMIQGYKFSAVGENTNSGGKYCQVLRNKLTLG